jgi:signal transduction histidine kinase
MEAATPMVIAADYPFMDVLWSMIIFFAWVAWIWVLIVIIGDLFRRHDTSGWVKAAWVVLLIVLPFLGTLLYLIVNGHGMGVRSAERAQAAQSQFNDYVQAVAAKDGGGGAASELEKAKGLLDSGALSQGEYDALKAKLLA